MRNLNPESLLVTSRLSLFADEEGWKREHRNEGARAWSRNLAWSSSLSISGLDENDGLRTVPRM